MSTIILLSSSPPPAFARSPTPADSSSPLPSVTDIIHDRSPSRRKFKTKSGPRDSFAAAFTTARQVLVEKVGAENTIITSPRRNRFRSSQEEINEAGGSKDLAQKARPFVKRQHVPPNSRSQLVEQMADPEKSTGSKDTKRHKAVTEMEPLLLERAVTRRLDWTPPKQNLPDNSDKAPAEGTAASMGQILSNFAYVTNGGTKSVSVAVMSNPAKRRRIDFVGEMRSRNTEALEAPEAPSAIKSIAKLSKQGSSRSHSPAKKALTITGLATSNYLGREDEVESPMMQYLTSTQAQLIDTAEGTGLAIKVKKTKALAKKLKGRRKTDLKTVLLSPTSAMKNYQEQEAIFGSASQLVREEQPDLLHDAIEAMRQSESFLMSDPYSSPQRTQALSVEHTPQAGTARFRKTRNLWAAAGRDEDNALLHLDVVDLTDTPAIRAAFAGKDVMVQPVNKPAAVDPDPTSFLHGGTSTRPGKKDGASIVNISDTRTPMPGLVRAFTSTSHQTSPRSSPSRACDPARAKSAEKFKTVPPTKQPPAPKPNYTGMSIHDLNKQIKAYGFKAMRKREKMVELLDRCWEEKHGLSGDITGAKTERTPFGDILSKVHDISARPEPKVKKPCARKKKEDIESEAKQKPIRKPRQRKSKTNEEGAGVESAQPKAKVSRKRKSKADLVGGMAVFDVDGVSDIIPEDLRQLQAFDDWARPERKRKSETHKVSTPTADLDCDQPPTPPATLPTVDKSVSQTITTDEDVPLVKALSSVPGAGLSTLAPTPPLLSLSFQITAAIQHQSRSRHPERNHNVNPTWHEKILLYDPIVLEDLATWLNTEGLGAIGEDREVSALEVREWCEGQGICCLWRGGWRGNKSAQ